GKESNRLWIVDPIDGTKEFINRTGEFSIQVALAINGILSLGAVYQPTSSILYLAAKNEGCWQYSYETNWKRLYVSESYTPNLTLAVSRNHPCPLGQKIHKSLNGTNQISRGGVGLKLMAIAKHEANYYINNSNKTKAWDSAAPEILFEEAGGIITDLKGNSFSYDPKDYRHKKGLVASCSKELHEKVLKLAQIYS
ncbi:MAG: 3'(2'),5'-bisphosphate nucleotidase CysQ, partial [Candidatus Riflebacteria bacterium]|nr:3'(2'),5'-bisphosphate nucleotidase CysQ [Candidatus Riflebacteria bacterium]